MQIQCALALLDLLIALIAQSLVSQLQQPSLLTMAAKHQQHSPSANGNSKGSLWFTPDPKYPTAGAEFVIISSDKVAFGVSEFAIRHR